MGKIGTHRPVLLVCAVTSQYPDAFTWAAEQVELKWGLIGLKSANFEFRETQYYAKSMGANLFKEFWAFETLLDPADLAAAKQFSNRLEEEYKANFNHDVERPLNLDPGYLTEAKLVLATTKDRDHRIYLQGGIFAEVTLFFNKGNWTARPWTYPDYQRPDFQEFFSECRSHLRDRYQKMAADASRASSPPSPG